MSKFINFQSSEYFAAVDLISFIRISQSPTGGQLVEIADRYSEEIVHVEYHSVDAVKQAITKAVNSMSVFYTIPIKEVNTKCPTATP